MKLLDRLMARQSRLMARLDPPRVPAPPIAHAARAATSPASALPDLAAESTARSAAAAHLESGDLAAARAALQPFIDTGGAVATLTTLARICTDQGDLLAALAALQRAETLDPADRKVWRLMAKLLTTQRRAREALVYLRRLALADGDASAAAQVELLRGLLRTQEKGPNVPRVDQAARAELELVLKRFETAPGIDDSLRLQFAGLYYLLSYGSPEAARIYNAAAPCPPSHRDVTATVVSLDSWSAEHQRPPGRATDSQGNASRHALYTLENVQIHPALGWLPVLAEGSFMPSGHLLQSKHFQGNTPHSPLMMFRGSHAELRLPRHVPTETVPAILVGGSASYYETVVHHLSGLAIAEQAGAAHEQPLAVRAHMPAFQLELLALLGYGSNRLIEVADDRPMRFQTLLVPSPLAVGPRSIDPLVGRWYRTRLVAAQTPAARRKLYVTPGPSVPIVNAAAVAALLAEHGFDRIDTSTMSVREQVDVFAAARQVVGATHEGLTNIVFSAAGTKVLEFRPLHWAASGGHMHFEPLARACGHDYSVQESTRAGVGVAGETAISVDLERLRERLEAWS